MTTTDTTTACSFLDATSHTARQAIRCSRSANHMVQDRRPLPDGKLRPAVPSCETHALAMLETGHYGVSFGLLVVR